VSEIVFVVPGRLDQLTGGYLYDRNIVEGLRAGRRPVRVIELGPIVDAAEFAAIPDGAKTVIDGLALPSLAEVIAAEAPRLRLVGLIHGPVAQEAGLSPAAAERAAAVEAALLSRMRGVLCPSRSTAIAVASYGIPVDRIAVVPPGTAQPNPPVPPSQRPVRALLCVANLLPRKGHVVLVEALAQIRDLEWSLLCIGSVERDPATAREVRRMISGAGLDGRITLAGEQPQEAVGDAYRVADLFVLPSFHEGYGMVYAEAMAHGLPIVGTTAGAIPETVPREAGLLVPPGDPVALAQALRRVISEPALSARLAVGSRAAGLRLPDWPRATNQWESALNQLAMRDHRTISPVAGGAKVD
jgi:glycosyltransferase involved in cell wall biosynthesis